MQSNSLHFCTLTMSSTHDEPRCHVGSQTDSSYSTTFLDQLTDKICAQQSQLDIHAMQIAAFNEEFVTIKAKLVSLFLVIFITFDKTLIFT